MKFTNLVSAQFTSLIFPDINSARLTELFAQMWKNIDYFRYEGLDILNAICTIIGYPKINNITEKYKHYETEGDLVAAASELPIENSILLLGITATLHSNGHTREQALIQLAKIGTAEIIPYLLLCLNDHVPIICNKALEFCEKLLFNFHPTSLIKFCSLLEKLKTFDKLNLNDLQNRLVQYIATPLYREAMLNYLNNSSLQVHLFYFNAVKKYAILDQNLINYGLSHPHHAIRALAATYISPQTMDMLQIEKLFNDPSSDVGYAVLQALNKQYSARFEPLFISALFNKTSKIRAIARFVLKQFTTLNLKSITQQKIFEYHPITTAPIGVILGWLDFATSDNLAIIEQFTKYPNKIVKIYSYKTLLRLKLLDNHVLFLNGINNTNNKIRNICAIALKDIITFNPQIKADLIDIIEHAPSKTKCLAFKILYKAPEVSHSKIIYYALLINNALLNNLVSEYLMHYRAIRNQSEKFYPTIEIPENQELNALWQKIVISCKQGNMSDTERAELLKIVKKYL